MRFFNKNFLKNFCRNIFCVGIFFLCCFQPAHADIVDSYNLAPLVPLVLEIMMNIATSLYDYFVGNGTGIIYILVYAFLLFYLCLYLTKMYLPKDWLSFIGFSGGGEFWDNKTDAWSIADNVMKPCFRAIVAIFLLLQIKPVYVTEWLVNPFLEFGSLYTEEILSTVTSTTAATQLAPVCPESIEKSGWISKRSCDFLIQPVFIISKENNKVIKYGFDFLKTGLRDILTLFLHSPEPILNIITGILLLVAFVSANLFMALLIIQAIFDFCLSLILYPFSVLTWVAKKSDKWFDVMPAFNPIIDSLKKLVITMIACAFILCVNIAIVHALFNWSSSVFVVAAGGVSNTNVPAITNTAMNFGQHSILWLSAILTFFLMQNIFKMTRERLDMYTSGTKHDLHTKVTGDLSRYWEKIKAIPGKIETIWDIGEKASKKK